MQPRLLITVWRPSRITYDYKQTRFRPSFICQLWSFWTREKPLHTLTSHLRELCFFTLLITSLVLNILSHTLVKKSCNFSSNIQLDFCATTCKFSRCWLLCRKNWKSFAENTFISNKKDWSLRYTSRKAKTLKNCLFPIAIKRWTVVLEVGAVRGMRNPQEFVFFYIAPHHHELFWIMH